MNYSNNNASGVLLGVLIGGLIGATVMLLMAPQSGEETRTKIQKKSVELRDRTNDALGGAMTQLRSGAKRVTVQGRKQFRDMKKQGKDMALDQLDRVSDAIQSGKSAVRGA